jgi:hypothetical protein
MTINIPNTYCNIPIVNISASQKQKNNNTNVKAASASLPFTVDTDLTILSNVVACIGG